MFEQSKLNNWNYVDLWNVISSDKFTNTAIHVTPDASAELASLIAESILELANEGDAGKTN
jgi:hypothetical protein